MTRIIPRTRNTMQGMPAFICGGASDFALTGLYLPIRCQAVIVRRCFRDEKPSVYYSRGCRLRVVDRMWGRSRISRSRCLRGGSSRRSTGRRRLQEFRRTARRNAGRRSIRGKARLVWTCWYRERGNAFEAAQRSRAEAQAVKFQEGSYLVLVRWNNAPKANVSALVRAVEKATAPK